MKKLLVLGIILCSVVLAGAQTKKFSQEALNDPFSTLDDKTTTLEDVLAKHQGKTIFIDVWASWCGDCREGIPGVQELQEKYGKEVTFVWISLDRSKDAWKNAVEKYNLQGDHYFVDKGWKGSAFCSSIELDWIPRYMIVGPDGEIELYKAIKTNDKTLLETLKVTK